MCRKSGVDAGGFSKVEANALMVFLAFLDSRFANKFLFNVATTLADTGGLR